MESINQQNGLHEDFAAIFEAYEKGSQSIVQGTIVKGVIIDINDKTAEIDIGAKSSGFVPLSEFRMDGEVNVGDVVDVYLQRLENKNGEVVVSRESARKRIDWNFLKHCMQDETTIDAHIMGRVKGGYAVEYRGIVCFLPRSQVDVVFLGDNDNFLIGSNDKFRVLKIDDLRGNVVVSRRAVLETKRSEERQEILSKINVGDVMEGVVKNITDYGAFIDFGGFDGLLHLTDISWSRIKHPSEAISLGDTVKVQIIKYDDVTKRVSLGMKQLQSDPWDGIAARYAVGSMVKGKVTNITGYGAFVEIERGVEGLVHVSEMSWLKKQNIPSKIVSVGQEVNVMVLDIDPTAHRISLGMKQCEKNPWQEFSNSHHVGDVVRGKVKNYTDFGLFIDLDNGIDGLVHVSDVSASGDSKTIIESLEKGSEIDVVVLGSNFERERISLGIKHTQTPGFKDQIAKLQEGASVSCQIVSVKKDFIEVELDFGIKGIIKRSDISEDKEGQKTDSFEVGDRVDAKVALFNNVTGRLLLSIKELDSSSVQKDESE